MKRWRVVVGFALLAVAGCQRADPVRVEPLPPASYATASTVPVAVSSPGSALPAFSTLSTLVVEQKQGGPSILHCKGVVSELTIDLARDTWTKGLCTAVKDDPASGGAEPLTITKGKLTPAARTTLDAAYAKLTIGPAGGCGADGGAITITVTPTAGPPASYVDENWGCKKPPPVIAKGARDFSMALYQLFIP